MLGGKRGRQGNCKTNLCFGAVRLRAVRASVGCLFADDLLNDLLAGFLDIGSRLQGQVSGKAARNEGFGATSESASVTGVREERLGRRMYLLVIGGACSRGSGSGVPSKSEGKESLELLAVHYG